MFDRDDDYPHGCIRGEGDGWGPNQCRCSRCDAERKEAARKQAHSDARYRALGFDPQADVDMVIVPVEQGASDYIARLAAHKGCTQGELCALILQRWVTRYKAAKGKAR